MHLRRNRKPSDTENRHNDRWLLSYADLITLLLALFIVLYAASDRERARGIAQSFSALDTRGDGILPANDTSNDTERRMLENPVLAQKTKMSRTARGFTISISEAGFFAPGDATARPEVESIIDEIAAPLKDSGALISVEGHTDSTPISNSQYPSNWELSTARASSVLMLLLDCGIAPERLSAAGYGGFRPSADNSTVEGRAMNRRVDIVVLNR